MALSNRPLYLQVRDTLAERIAKGGLKPGSTIPNEIDLAREIGVSAGTVRKALEIMQSEHLIVRRQGRGTFVRDPRSDEVASRYAKLHGADGRRIHGKIRSTDISLRAARDMERERLRLHREAAVYQVRRLHEDDGRIFLVEDSTLPAELFPGLGEGRPVADQIGELAREHGVLLGSAHERISTAEPPAPIAGLLGVAPGTSVIVMDRLVLMLDGRRVLEWRVAHCHLPGSYYLADIR